MDRMENSKVCQECACSCLVDRFICSVEGHWHVFAVLNPLATCLRSRFKLQEQRMWWQDASAGARCLGATMSSTHRHYCA